jgi:GNAT superfamily N-acetyltransferase
MEPFDLSDVATARSVLAVQRSAYQQEAELIGSAEIPPLLESLDDLMRAPLEWIGVREGGEIVAALAYARSDDGIDIDRLVVAPAAMRRGYGSALVEALGRDEVITVSTGTGNRPAHQLYVSLGFEVTGESMPVPGLSITHYERLPDG